MYLEINQATDRTERVASSVVSKLYNLAYDDPVQGSQLDQSSNVIGSISVPAAYDTHITYLKTKFPNLHISSDSTYIKFEDPEVERVCVQQFSADGIGLTTAEASRITQIPNSLFKNNTLIRTFPELDRFGSTVSIGNSAFEGCSNLQSIGQNNITSIGNSAFLNCTSLAIDINMPKLTSLGNNRTFANSGITGVYSLGTIIKIPGRPGYGYTLFKQCNSMSYFNIPSTCVQTDDVIFDNCSSLTTISGEENLTSINGFAIGCNTQEILHFDSLISLVGRYQQSTFQNCTFRQLYFPKLQIDESVYDPKYKGTIERCNVQLIYFRDNQKFVARGFPSTSCNALVFNNTTPITCIDSPSDQRSDGKAANMFQGATIGKIYVPNPEVWKADSFWSTWADKFANISELPVVQTEADLQEGQIALIAEYM